MPDADRIGVLEGDPATGACDRAGSAPALERARAGQSLGVFARLLKTGRLKWH